MTIAAFLDLERADKWLKGMEDLGYVVTGEKTAASGTVHVLDKLSAASADHGTPSHLQAAERNVPGHDAGPSPSWPGDFYSDASTQELHAEMVRLSQVLQARGVIA